MYLLSYKKKCQRSLQSLKNKVRIGSVKLVVIVRLYFSLFLTRTEITFQVATFGGPLFSEDRYFWHLLTSVKFSCFFRRIATFRGSYFEISTVMPVESMSSLYYIYSAST